MTPTALLGEDCTLQLGQYDERRNRVAALLNRLSEIAKRLHAPQFESELSSLTKDLESEVFRLVVVGEFSRGKSTVINALLGERVLPSAVKPTTAVLSTISSSTTSSYNLHFHDGTKQEISAEEFSSLVAPLEPHRRDDEGRIRYEAKLRKLRGIAMARILHPSPFCPAGVEIVDTPGTNDLDPMREQITYGFVPRADAVLFVLSAKSILAQSEIDFLRDRILKADIQRVFFLVNFSDLLDEADRGKVHAYASKQLATLVESPRIYMVSARHELQRATGKEFSPEDTGFGVLRQELSRFLADERGSIKLARPTARGVRFCDELVRGPLTVMRASVGIELPDLMNRITELKPKIEQVERERDMCVSQLRVALTNRRLELAQVLRTGLGGVARAAVNCVDGYSGRLNRQDIGRYLEQGIAPAQTAFQSKFSELQSQALNDETQVVQRRLQSVYRSLEGSVQNLFTRADSLAVYSQLESQDSEDKHYLLANVGGVGIGIAAIGLHLFFPLAILAGWFGSLLFRGHLEDVARIEALGKIRLEIDQRYRESIPATVAAFEKQWDETTERTCSSLETDFNRHCNELQSQLDQVVIEHGRTLRSAEERRYEIDNLVGEIDEIRIRLQAECR